MNCGWYFSLNGLLVMSDDILVVEFIQKRHQKPTILEWRFYVSTCKNFSTRLPTYFVIGYTTAYKSNEISLWKIFHIFHICFTHHNCTRPSSICDPRTECCDIAPETSSAASEIFCSQSQNLKSNITCFVSHSWTRNQSNQNSLQIALVKLVRNVPAEWAKVTSLLHNSVKNCERKNTTIPDLFQIRRWRHELIIDQWIRIEGAQHVQF